MSGYTTQIINDQSTTDAQPMALAGHSSRPQVIIDSASGTGHLGSTDAAWTKGPAAVAAGVLNGEGSVVREYVRNEYYGTYLVLRMRTPVAVTAISTLPQVALFGRYGLDNQWHRLRNANDGLVSAMTFDADEDAVSGGTPQYRVSTPTKDHIYDMLGFNRFIALPVVAAASVTGGATTDLALLANTV